jgi:hypothetical protein
MAMAAAPVQAVKQTQVRQQASPATARPQEPQRAAVAAVVMWAAALPQ